MARTSKLILVLTLVLSGCGASTPESLPSTTTSTQPRESTTTTEAVEKSAMLDFSPIAGEWSGMLESLRAGTSSRSPIPHQPRRRSATGIGRGINRIPRRRRSHVLWDTFRSASGWIGVHALRKE